MIIDRPKINISNKKMKPKKTVVYDTYWKFATERQSIFFKRLNNEPFPWTNDIILRLFKFTNAYRASDRVSQYLIRNVIYSGSEEPKEVLFRILFFKLFNKIETWEVVTKKIGEVSYNTYSYELYNSILENIKLTGNSIYSGAYIMASGKNAFGHDFKHQNHLKLLEKIMEDRLHEKIQELKSMSQLYDVLEKYPTIGSFLAYQYAIDINYSTLTNFSEMEFVKAGPGAKDGIRKCFSDIGEYTEEDIIKMMVENQEKEFDRLNLDFKNLWGRNLQLIDCQNLFCEVDKYSRIAHPEIEGISDRKRIKQRFHPRSLGSMKYFFPPKWGIKLST